jgi:hypothetical protein
MEDTEVPDSVLPIEKWLPVGEVCTLEGLVVISDMRLSQAGMLVTSRDVFVAAGPVTSDVTTSDIVTVAVNEVITSDTVTVKVIVLPSGIVVDKVWLFAGKLVVSQCSTSPHTPVSHGLVEQQPVKGPTAHL